VRDYNPETGMALIEQRNKMCIGDEIEIFGPNRDFFTQTIEVMQNAEGEPIESAPHPQQILEIKMTRPVAPGFMLRKRK